MKKDRIREEKTCLNCGTYVAEKYCPHCGQKNVEYRDSIKGLFRNFLLDLIQGESSVWTSIKLLFIAPQELSKEYIRGRRRAYIDPIKLYIFISFEALFIPSILPEKNVKSDAFLVDVHQEYVFCQTDQYTQEGEMQVDSLGNALISSSVSAGAMLVKGKQKEAFYSYLFKKLVRSIKSDKSQEEEKKLKKFLLYNFPKALFVFLPFFAFYLWFLNDKKKFLFFDSGVFTLHLFSSIILIISILLLFDCAFDWLNLPSVLTKIFGSLMLGYVVFLVFKANHSFYGGSWQTTCLKTCLILFVGLLMLALFLFLYLLVALYFFH